MKKLAEPVRKVNTQCVGMDVHKNLTVVCVLDGDGKTIREERMSSTRESFEALVHEVQKIRTSTLHLRSQPQLSLGARSLDRNDGLGIHTRRASEAYPSHRQLQRQEVDRSSKGAVSGEQREARWGAGATMGSIVGNC